MGGERQEWGTNRVGWPRSNDWKTAPAGLAEGVAVTGDRMERLGDS